MPAGQLQLAAVSGRKAAVLGRDDRAGRLAAAQLAPALLVGVVARGDRRRLVLLRGDEVVLPRDLGVDRLDLPLDLAGNRPRRVRRLLRLELVAALLHLRDERLRGLHLTFDRRHRARLGEVDLAFARVRLDQRTVAARGEQAIALGLPHALLLGLVLRARAARPAAPARAS